MSEQKSYESIKIPVRNSGPDNHPDFASDELNAGSDISFDYQPFAEIEIDGGINTTTQSELIPHRIEPIIDEKRSIFNEMRDIVRYNHASYFASSKFFHKQVQYENSKIFYKQAVFMKDFEDDYSDSVSFSSYFPNYQMLSYEQLRTYFTWRTKVRKGDIENTSLSYAFLYIYELLNNIGTSSPADGLCKLMTFWSSYKSYDTTIEKYLRRWVKDYHVYYELPVPFKDFLIQYDLKHHYLEIAEYELESRINFTQLCDISKYNIKQSAFYNDETSGLISDCFDFLMDKLQGVFTKTGISFDSFLYQPAKSKTIWSPFHGALFFPVIKQRDRRVELSDNEIYVCNKNVWLLSKVITIESGRHLLGYIMKQMESELRQLTKYKFKLTANFNALGNELVNKLNSSGISLEKVITDAVLVFYRERNKTVVSVDLSSLHKIRLEALDTQEKLTVPETDTENVSASAFITPPMNSMYEEPAITNPVLSGGWQTLKDLLSTVEIKALATVVSGDKEFRQFANENGVMPEVLADSINEKAFDCIGDNILELDDSMIYDEYIENIIKMVE